MAMENRVGGSDVGSKNQSNDYMFRSKRLCYADESSHALHSIPNPLKMFVSHEKNMSRVYRNIRVHLTTNSPPA
jgi:hypothetical protein